ncbi:hypothetical protein ACA910_000975 [Epithemia clementina (nom. ined.)]
MTGNGPNGKVKGAGSFQALKLSPEVFKGIQKMGYQQPTPVQRQALPILLTGVDAVVMARTGSGKTAAFIIPLLEKLIQEKKQEEESGSRQQRGVRGVILSPTRELSLQTLRVLQKMGAQTEFRFIGIHGSEGMEKQFALLSSQPDVIVATPGRLAHHLTEIADFTLQSCTTLILDEADRLLEMGLAQQIRQIAKSVSPSSQKILLSATLPKVLVEFTQQHNNLNLDDNLSVIRLDQEATVSADLRMAFITCRSMEKDAALLHLLSHIQEQQQKQSRQSASLTLIFAATRHHVEYIASLIASAPEFSSNMQPTVIYGTLDSEARRSNLAAFRSGAKPVLVVTDVAARGVDVPLIDHVIHYHFPPSPKLFVHRSGRAARAGRIGYGWALVDPEEMPYMVDLHVFLGRRLTTSLKPSYTSGNVEKTSLHQPSIAYSLSDMTPEMVHFGSIPESVMTTQVEHVSRLSDNVQSLAKVCENAMKQYRRTRPLASKNAVQRAKAILDGQTSLDSTDLPVVVGGAIPIHPLFVHEMRNSADTSSPKALNSRENIKEREAFLRSLSQFRPKESVFEAFATGGGKQVGVLSQVDKGRTTSDSKKKHDSSAALTAMKNMRRQMRMARDKAMVVAGSETAQGGHTLDGEAAEQVNGSDEVSGSDDVDQVVNTSSSGNVTGHSLSSHSAVIAVTASEIEGKRRMSKAERKRLKKDTKSSTGSTITTTEHSETGSKKKKDMRSSDFRDPSYFIENDFTSNSEEAYRSRQVEAAMQPSSGSSGKGGGSLMGAAARMEEAMLDIVGDENEELVKRQRMMRWDKSKRKYVQTTVGEELSGESKSKRLRLESGQVVKNDKLKLGELYEKWQKKTNRSIGRSGVFDDVDGGIASPPSLKRGRGRDKKQKDQSGGHARGAKNDDGNVKTAEQIKKERAKSLNMKVKNMKRADRRALEQKQKSGTANHTKSKHSKPKPSKSRKNR